MASWLPDAGVSWTRYMKYLKFALLNWKIKYLLAKERKEFLLQMDELQEHPRMNAKIHLIAKETTGFEFVKKIVVEKYHP